MRAGLGINAIMTGAGFSHKFGRRMCSTYYSRIRAMRAMIHHKRASARPQPRATDAFSAADRLSRRERGQQYSDLWERGHCNGWPRCCATRLGRGAPVIAAAAAVRPDEGLEGFRQGPGRAPSDELPRSCAGCGCRAGLELGVAAEDLVGQRGHMELRDGAGRRGRGAELSPWEDPRLDDHTRVFRHHSAAPFDLSVLTVLMLHIPAASNQRPAPHDDTCIAWDDGSTARPRCRSTSMWCLRDAAARDGYPSAYCTQRWDEPGLQISRFPFLKLSPSRFPIPSRRLWRLVLFRSPRSRRLPYL